MLEKEFQYYLDHQDDLVDKYEGKYLVIIDEKVVGAYDSDSEAYFAALEEHEPGTFLIQLCEKGEEAYTQTFHSRVKF